MKKNILLTFLTLFCTCAMCYSLTYISIFYGSPKMTLINKTSDKIKLETSIQKEDQYGLWPAGSTLTIDADAAPSNPVSKDVGNNLYVGSSGANATITSENWKNPIVFQFADYKGFSYTQGPSPTVMPKVDGSTWKITVTATWLPSQNYELTVTEVKQ